MVGQIMLGIIDALQTGRETALEAHLAGYQALRCGVVCTWV